MDSIELKHLARRASDQLFGHLMPFWCGPAVDHEQGGWMGWLANDLKPDRTQPKGLIVNCRILWAFSAVHRARPEKLYQQMAGRALDFVTDHFWDSQSGGAFWRLDDSGKVIDDSKKIYGQAFYIYALTEFHRAFGGLGGQPALERAKELFELIERHAHDAKFGGYLEVCKRDWSEAGADARLSEKDMNEKKSMNNHLHVLEAYTNLYRVWKEARVAERLRELIEIFLTRILDARTNHFHHFFDEQWRVRSDTYTFGHDIEGSWLLCEAAEELGDQTLMERVRAVVLPMAGVVLNESFTASGAIYYEGKGGEIIDHGRECWPQAEAVIGFLNAYQLSGDEKFLEAAQRAWNFIEQHLVDRVHGEWFWRINENGQPDPKLPKVSEWKGPYHGSRVCLETLHRVKIISAAKKPQ
ncbi:MAG TPA: AGE family epimerase/isomerase [Candidatus Limnocylindrales bacterium]|nr:AGE family epimerase/isomerase [Candidatus Limnocylindrales bacterium]